MLSVAELTLQSGDTSIPEVLLPRDMESSKDYKKRLAPLDDRRLEKSRTLKYKPDYALIAFEVLTSGKGAICRAHVCAALSCGENTLRRWESKYPEFKQAISDGMLIGKAIWLERLGQYAFQPSGLVNNGLIKLLSSFVYNVSDNPREFILQLEGSKVVGEIDASVSEKEAVNLYIDMINDDKVLEKKR